MTDAQVSTVVIKKVCHAPICHLFPTYIHLKKKNILQNLIIKDTNCTMSQKLFPCYTPQWIGETTVMEALETRRRGRCQPAQR